MDEEQRKAKRAATRKWEQEHPEQHKAQKAAYMREYFKRNREQKIAAAKRYYEANRDKVREKREAYQQTPKYRAWLERTREKRKEYLRGWRKDSGRAKEHERRNLAKAQEKSAQLALVKAAAGCRVCGERDPLVLDFHHRDPSEKYADVGTLVRMKVPRLMAEVKKCDVLCANCHRRHHPPTWWPKLQARLEAYPER